MYWSFRFLLLLTVIEFLSKTIEVTPIFPVGFPQRNVPLWISVRKAPEPIVPKISDTPEDKRFLPKYVPKVSNDNIEDKRFLPKYVPKVSKVNHSRTDFENYNKKSPIQNLLERLLILIQKFIQQSLLKYSQLNKTLRKTTAIPRNCQEVEKIRQKSPELFLIQPKYSPKPFFVRCRGNWTIFLNRNDGRQNFDLGWNDYKAGFGNLGAEFWLGLEKLHLLTGYEINELLVELIDWKNTMVYAHYGSFSVGSNHEGYSLKILDGYNGTAGDSFQYHAGCKFSTKDKDQDEAKKKNCARDFHGGWWFKNCRRSLLTGMYHKGYVNVSYEYQIMHWDGFHGPGYSLKEARMMIKPKN